MSLHHARSLARIYWSRAWIVTIVMNIAIYDSCYKWKRFQKIVSIALYSLSLCKHFQGMRVFNCNWIWKIKYFRIFFLRFCLSSSLKRVESYHYYFLSLSSFQFSAVRPDNLPWSGLQIRPWNQTTSAAHKIRPRSDHHTRQSDESQIRPQIRPCTNYHTRPLSDQTTKISPSDQTTAVTPDHQIRSAQ